MAIYAGIVLEKLFKKNFRESIRERFTSVTDTLFSDDTNCLKYISILIIVKFLVVMISLCSNYDFCISDRVCLLIYK